MNPSAAVLLRRLATSGRRGGEHPVVSMRTADRLCLVFGILVALAVVAVFAFAHTPWAN
jgi:hypothetical protein